MTASSYQGGAFGGVPGADSICNSDAKKPADGNTYKALIISGSLHPIRTSTVDWVLKPDTDYYLADGSTFQTTDENGVFTSFSPIQAITRVWTGLYFQGVGIWEPFHNCHNWTSSSSGVKGQWGRSDYSSVKLFSYDNELCNQRYHLYCVGQ